ncbi:MAG TPA: spore coat protein [Ruminococcaceae bacterium]|nr:spore coat protein [Oscillospiraceae bacterium]
MDDRSLMENMLMLEKGACDLFMHGSIEASSQDVKQAFNSSLTQALDMQSQIYSKMQAKGWYPSQEVEQTKINEVKMKFSQPQC